MFPRLLICSVAGRAYDCHDRILLNRSDSLDPVGSDPFDMNELDLSKVRNCIIKSYWISVLASTNHMLSCRVNACRRRGRWKVLCGS